MSGHAPLPNFVAYIDRLDKEFPSCEPIVLVFQGGIGCPADAAWAIFDNIDRWPGRLFIIKGFHWNTRLPDHPRIQRISSFYSGDERADHGKSISFNAANFMDVGRDALKLQPHLAVAMVTMPRIIRGEKCWSLGASATYIPFLTDHEVPLFVIENPNMPWTQGNTFYENVVVGSDVTDIHLHTANPKPSTLEEGTKDWHIATYTAGVLYDELPVDENGEHIVDLQIGVGNKMAKIPRACQALGVRIRRVRSEAIGDWARDPSLEGVHFDCTVILGSDELLAWANDNPFVHVIRVDQANSRETLSSPYQAGINTANAVTTEGAVIVGAKRRVWSGVGGAEETTHHITDASGVTILVLNSTFTKNDQTFSTIVNKIDEGYLTVTNNRRPGFVVTEHGVARTREKVFKDRSRFLARTEDVVGELVKVADRRFAPGLVDEAEDMGLLRQELAQVS